MAILLTRLSARTIGTVSAPTTILTAYSGGSNLSQHTRKLHEFSMSMKLRSMLLNKFDKPFVAIEESRLPILASVLLSFLVQLSPAQANMFPTGLVITTHNGQTFIFPLLGSLLSTIMVFLSSVLISVASKVIRMQSFVSAGNSLELSTLSAGTTMALDIA